MVAGIDFSSRAVHIALLADDTNNAGNIAIDLHGNTPFERVRSLRATFPGRSWWEDLGVYLVGIEDPHSRANHTAKALGLAAGAIAALLPTGLTVIQTPPAEWKRIFAGTPGATKEAVAERARELWPDCPTDGDNNTTDSYGIAYAVRHINNQAIEEARTA